MRFVAVDFATESAFDKLEEAAYDAGKNTLFLWEGVTLYLSEADVRKTMQEVRRSAPSGSVLLVDLYSHRLVRIGKGTATQRVLEYTDEALGFSLDFSGDFEETLAEFVGSETFAVGETFFLGRTSDKGALYVGG